MMSALSVASASSPYQAVNSMYTIF